MPLYRLKYNGRTSHLYGSIHCLSLSKLNKSDSPKINALSEFLTTMDTLVVENKQDIKNKTYYMNTENKIKEKMINELPNDDKFKLSYELSFNNKLYADGFNDYIKHKSINEELPKNSFFDFNVMRALKLINDPIYASLISHVNDISCEQLFKLMYGSVCFKGIDTNLSYHYANNKKPVYTLDRPDINTHYTKNIKICNYTMAMLTLYLFSKKYDKDIWYILEKALRELENKYLFETDKLDEMLLKKERDPYIVDGRNKLWLPSIINHHNVSKNVLFVTGYGHLVGLKSLLLQNGFEIQHIKDF